MAKPASTFNWADTPTTLRTDPPAGLKNTGFSVLTKLPAQYFNHLLGVCGDWLLWLNTRLFDGYTIPTDGVDCRLVADATALRVKTAAGAYRAFACGDPDESFLGMVPTVNWHNKNSCCLVVTVPQALSSTDPISWPFVPHDPSGMLDSVGEIVITPGIADAVWFLIVNVDFAAGTAGTMRWIGVYKNADANPITGLSGSVGMVAGIDMTVSCGGIIGGDGDPLFVGDTLTVKIAHNDGLGTINVNMARFSLIRIG